MPSFTVDVIAGTRPNFMKVAALLSIADEFPDLTLRLIHTGQHYDFSMSKVFLEDLDLPEPTHHLKVGSGTHSDQTAEIMKRYEKWVQSHRPDLCLVVGDVNSTAACAIVAAKEKIPIGHVEAGLRSFDRGMPEEINRMLTDSISDLFFATEASAISNLTREGHAPESVHLVGNVMIDTLFRMKAKAEKLKVAEKFGVQPHTYAYLTLHRPANVDTPEILGQILEQILWLAEKIPIIFPVHPRTQKSLKEFNWKEKLDADPNIHLIDPLGYLESLSVMAGAKLVITDSGGIQEETTALNIPCLTLRENTERPITIEKGSNTLIKRDWLLFQNCVKQVLENTYLNKTEPIPTWDGSSGRRILKICLEYLRK